MTLFLGKTITGDGRGKTLGFPTINISLQNEQDTLELQKNSGVFIVELYLNNTQNNILIGLLHLGSRPTFNEKEFRIEIFVLEDISENISLKNKKDLKNKISSVLEYIPVESDIQFRIIKKIREVICFTSADKLVEQIKQDVVSAENFYKENSFTL